MVSRNLWNVVGAVGLLFLAGCTGGSAPKVAPSSSAVPLVAPSGAADANTCGIEGFVGDESFLPIAGADVGIQGLNVETRTAQDGRFSFSFVQPGTHTIVVNALGYGTQSRRQACEPGERYDDLIFSLKELPKVGKPYRSPIFTKVGRIGCGVGFYVKPADFCGKYPDALAPGLPQLNANANRSFFVYPDVGTFITGVTYELVWTQTGYFSATSLELSWSPGKSGFGTVQSFCPGGERPFGGQNQENAVVGRSPICARLDSANATSFVYKVDHATQFSLRAGTSENTVEYLLGPTNKPDKNSKFVYDQPFTFYATFFYNGEPMPADFSGATAQ